MRQIRIDQSKLEKANLSYESRDIIETFNLVFNGSNMVAEIIFNKEVNEEEINKIKNELNTDRCNIVLTEQESEEGLENTDFRLYSVYKKIVEVNNEFREKVSEWYRVKDDKRAVRKETLYILDTNGLVDVITEKIYWYRENGVAIKEKIRSTKLESFTDKRKEAQAVREYRIMLLEEKIVLSLGLIPARNKIQEFVNEKSLYIAGDVKPLRDKINSDIDIKDLNTGLI